MQDAIRELLFVGGGPIAKKVLLLEEKIEGSLESKINELASKKEMCVGNGLNIKGEVLVMRRNDVFVQDRTKMVCGQI